MGADVDNVPAEGEPVDLLTAPAMRLACDRCREPALLRPGGICPTCVAVIGLAADDTEYRAWRGRVEDAIKEGSPAE